MKGPPVLTNRWDIELNTLMPWDETKVYRSVTLKRVLTEDWKGTIDERLNMYQGLNKNVGGGLMWGALEQFPAQVDGNGEAPIRTLTGMIGLLADSFYDIQDHFEHTWGGFQHTQGMVLLLAERIELIIKVLRAITRDDLLDEQVMLAFTDGSLRNVEPKRRTVVQPNIPSSQQQASAGAG